jgi:hypothetical protein
MRSPPDELCLTRPTKDKLTAEHTKVTDKETFEIKILENFAFYVVKN